MKPKGGMRQRAVVANRDAQSAEPRQPYGGGDHPPARRREEHETDRGENVDGDYVVKRRGVSVRRFPPRALPWFRTKAGDDRSVRRTRVEVSWRFCARRDRTSHWDPFSA